MKKEDKALIIEKIADTIRQYNGFYLVETAGLDAEKTSELRRACFDADIKLVVVKNTLLKRACEAAGIEGLESAFSGTTAIALSAEDIIIAPKLLFKKAEKSEGKFSIKLGFVDGKAISKEEVEAYAKLPSKETLLSQLVFMLQSPIQRLAIAISEIEKKQSEGEATA